MTRDKGDEGRREALLFERSEDGSVRCSLCRHRCRILPGGRGLCHVRENNGGVLETLVYGMLVAGQVDPVEKKPLFHFLPGSRTYSIATVGCNFRCRHCQNHTIAQTEPDADGQVPGQFLPPAEAVAAAVNSGSRSMSYTYTEPTIFFEYLLDTARLARGAGLRNVLVTNGYMTPEALDLVAPFVDAANIDLKGFDDSFYRRVTGARLDGVLECIRDYRRRNIWIEITSLIIPGENDSREQLEGMAAFIAEELGKDVPWHVSRFFPRYRMDDRPPTSPDTLVRAVEAGQRSGLRHIYVGNLAGGQEDTICPECHAVLVRREGFQVRENRLAEGSCIECGTIVPGVWR